MRAPAVATLTTFDIADQVAEMADKLKALLVEHGLETDGKVVLTQYHPKRAPRWMRINEARAFVSCGHP